jgi:hypothetical protein
MNTMEISSITLICSTKKIYIFFHGIIFFMHSPFRAKEFG